MVASNVHNILTDNGTISHSEYPNSQLMTSHPVGNITNGSEGSPMSEDLHNYHLIPVMVYVCILFVIGVPGNIFVCYIYYFKWTRKTSRVFILALAVFDLINNLVSLPTEIALLSNFHNFDYPVLCKVSRFLTFTMNSASATVLVGIGWDRLMGICYWSKMRPMKIRTAKLISAGAVILAFTTGWPALFIYGTFTHPYKTEQKTCLYADEYIGSIYTTIFAWYVLCSNLVYDTILAVLYFIIGRHIIAHQTSGRNGLDRFGPIRRPSAMSNSSVCEDLYLADNLILKNGQCKKGRFIWRSNSFNTKQYNSVESLRRNTMENPKTLNQSKPVRPNRSPTLSVSHRPSAFSQTFSSSSGSYVTGRRYRTGKTTTTLFVVTMVFIISFVPYCVISITRLSNVKAFFYENASIVGKVFYHLFLRTYFLSSVLNPLIYNGFNAKFRAECKLLIKKVLCFLCKCRE
ncbi:D(2) dopamine receptor A-like [Pecten maximus]|uniref:D(2) dopamine receptor A-like n=1 Tax=Pecten maximus TaxID=6579 RepID=UPI001458FDE7|nr:D(2) dopamine receptor A-like [Pecten maximus]XP_033726841.1 D(2) dopamine receptor A-like [Pecten maximus]XP_033726842.1 D(2) dopamine receptor A-like [Pecten maximus]XP_033726843.1 D(2) dopamine receptor A-like [Pecten maximus]XP_033726844.1 D(2) dopamine receptor A-like [Pecten maximus]